MQRINSQSLIDRMKGVATLDAATYEEVDQGPRRDHRSVDRGGLAAVAAGIGTLNCGRRFSGLIGGIIGRDPRLGGLLVCRYIVAERFSAG